ncbi:MAG: flagellar export chaperone FliS [Myxococcota bacterium]|nr:flagellar export chaperone FliS [Myxococcota bacterium]
MRGLNAYQAARVETASPSAVLVMLMHTAVLKLESALQRDPKDLPGYQADLHHVRSIYFELVMALDDAAAPELCAELRRLYSWCIRELVEASKSRSDSHVEGVLRVTRTLGEAWTEAVEEIS